MNTRTTLLAMLGLLLACGARAYPPAPASQAQADAGTEPYLYLTPKTFSNSVLRVVGSGTGQTATQVTNAVNTVLSTGVNGSGITNQFMIGAFWVSTNGSDTTGNGTMNQPWATTTNALAQGISGILYVGPGIYATGTNRHPRASRSGLYIKGSGEGVTIFQYLGDSTSYTGEPAFFGYSDGLILEGVTLQDTASSVNNFMGAIGQDYLDTGATNFLVRNCNFDGWQDVVWDNCPNYTGDGLILNCRANWAYDCFNRQASANVNNNVTVKGGRYIGNKVLAGVLGGSVINNLKGTNWFYDAILVRSNNPTQNVVAFNSSGNSVGTATYLYNCFLQAKGFGSTNVLNYGSGANAPWMFLTDCVGDATNDLIGTYNTGSGVQTRMFEWNYKRLDHTDPVIGGKFYVMPGYNLVSNNTVWTTPLIFSGSSNFVTQARAQVIGDKNTKNPANTITIGYANLGIQIDQATATAATTTLQVTNMTWTTTQAGPTFILGTTAPTLWSPVTNAGIRYYAPLYGP